MYNACIYVDKGLRKKAICRHALSEGSSRGHHKVRCL